MIRCISFCRGERGKLKEEHNYKDFEYNGGYKWYESGEKKSEIEQKNWETTSIKNYHKNGNKNSFGKVKNKKWDGTYSEW